MTNETFSERGRVGQKRFAGVFYEEFQRDLTGARGVEVYREMSENDDMIGAVMFSIEMLLRQAAFDVVPGGEADADRRAAKFVRECMDDMAATWQDTLSEMLSFLVFGWSYHELCYKRRLGQTDDKETASKFSDGLISWSKLPIRAQDTLSKWEYDPNDRLLGMWQRTPPDFEERFIPIEKSVHLITKSRKWNPEGRSILRNAYRACYFKKRLQEIEGIGAERDLAGFPIIQPPEGINLWDESDPDAQRQLSIATDMVKNIRRDALEGAVIPPGWSLSLITSGGRRQFDVGAIIERYDRRIAMTVMADFILLGSQAVGSFALSSDKTALFSVALGTYLKIITDAFNTQAIPRLIELNREAFPGLTACPAMVHGDIEKPNLTELSGFIERMTGVGLLTPDENLESYVRRVAELPEKMGGRGDGL